MKRKFYIIGVLHLDLFALVKILNNTKSKNKITFVCRSKSLLVNLILKFYKNYKITLLPKPYSHYPNDPFWLSAKHFCNKDQISFRKEAVNTVNDVTLKIYENYKKKFGKIFGKIFIDNDYIFQSFFQNQLGEEIKSSVYFLYHFESIKINNKIKNKHFEFYIPNYWWSEEFVKILNFKLTNTKVFFNPFARIDTYLWWNFSLKPQDTSKNNHYYEKYIKENDEETINKTVKTKNLLKASSNLSCVVSDTCDLGLRNNIGWIEHTKFKKSNFKLILDDQITKKKPTSLSHYFNDGLEIFYVNQIIIEKKYFKTLFKIFDLITSILEYRYDFLSKFEVWIFYRFSKLLKLSKLWQKFFLENNISFNIDHHFGIQSYARALALANVDGYTIADARSFYYDNNDNNSIRAHDFFFNSGTVYKNFFSNSNSRMGEEINTGLSPDGGKYFSLKLKKILKKSHLKKVLIIEEPGQIYGAENVYDYLNIILKNCYEKRDHILIFKPKRIEVLFYFLNEKNREKFDYLVKNKLVHVLPNKVSIFSCTNYIDICVSVPSSAMYYTLASKIPTLIYNPFNVVRSVLNKKTERNTIIFTSLDLLIIKLNNLLSNKIKYKDNFDLRLSLDSSEKLLGDERKAKFIDILLKNNKYKSDKYSFLKKCSKKFKSFYK